MKRVTYYHSRDDAARLRKNVDKHLDWYYGGTGADPREKLPLQAEARGATKIADVGAALSLDEGVTPKDDARHAVAVYAAMGEITPQEAADGRLWTYLCHNECRAYVAARWLKDRPEDEETAATKVRNHFFAKSSRNVFRDNGVSRLWWLGHTASQVDGNNPRLFLDILMQKQDMRSALIERPSVSMNVDILKAIYEVMKEAWHSSDGPKAKLFERAVFREWMRRLNRRGGVMVLDAVPCADLVELLREEARASGAF